ncbi:hypothetical protein MASR1M32_37700 [Rhodobacter sp.]
MSALFFPPPADPATVVQRAGAFAAAHPGAFSGPEDARTHLHDICLPASGRWAYAMTTKAASSSMKRLLFQLEFGQPLTTDVNDPNDLNGDAATTRLLDTGLFARAYEVADPAATLAGALRITTVRDPALRAVSAFKHLCRAHSRSDIPFYAERLHISAVTGLDWAKDSYRGAGLERFLTFIDWAYTSGRTDLVDPHWRRQTEIIRPAIFRPDITARVEDLPLPAPDCRATGQTPARGLRHPHANASPAATGRDLLTPAAEALITRIYAADYEAFGY